MTDEALYPGLLLQVYLQCTVYRLGTQYSPVIRATTKVSSTAVGTMACNGVGSAVDLPVLSCTAVVVQQYTGTNITILNLVDLHVLNLDTAYRYQVPLYILLNLVLVESKRGGTVCSTAIPLSYMSIDLELHVEVLLSILSSRF